ncbi:MAG: hypothetical protein R3E32_07790 [Chitinophagales bacterium]
MKYLLFLAMLSLWLQCADTNQQTSETQQKTTAMDKDKDENQEQIDTKNNEKPNYRYVDGSNNTYVITPTSIDYQPIDKMMSSSGDYDGGEPVTKDIDETQYAAIQAAMQAAIENTAAHIEKREMGSGWISAAGKSYKIAYRAKEKGAIEKVLREVIKTKYD